VPLPAALRMQQRIELEGDIPSPIDPPAGCPFHTRCRAARPTCAHEPPAWRELRPNHWVACHFATADGPPSANLPELSPTA